MAPSSDLPQSMKALRLVQFNKNYQLQKDVPVPTPGPGELLVRVAAAGFCHTDYQVYEGAYGTELPFIGSHEPAGTIAALGPDVPESWKVGDRVGVLNFSNPCGTCSGCKWRRQTGGSLDARYCDNKTMSGILRADGGFAEYMIASHYTLVPLPDNLEFDQAAPLMCAGATVWNAIRETGLEKGETLAIVGIGGLGVLGVQFAKALGYRVAAIDKFDAGLQLAMKVPKDLVPDIVVNIDDPEANQKLSEFSDGIGIAGAVVCTDNVPASDWMLHRLRPRGTCVVLGLPEEGFKFDAFNLVFREIVVKGSLHSGIDEVNKMLKVVAQHDIKSSISRLPLEEGEDIPEKMKAKAFKGKLVVTI